MNEYHSIFKNTCEEYISLLITALYPLYPDKGKKEIEEVIDEKINEFLELSQNEEAFNDKYDAYNINYVINLDIRLSIFLSIMSYIRATRYYAEGDYINSNHHINEAIFNAGTAYGYYIQIFSEQHSTEHMSKAASNTEKAKNSRRIKQEIIDFLSDNAWKNAWQSIDDCIPEIIEMLQKKANATGEFKINPNTIRTNIKKWSRSSSESQSDQEFQENLAEIFSSE